MSKSKKESWMMSYDSWLVVAWLLVFCNTQLCLPTKAAAAPQAVADRQPARRKQGTSTNQ